VILTLHKKNRTDCNVRISKIKPFISRLSLGIHRYRVKDNDSFCKYACLVKISTVRLMVI